MESVYTHLIFLELDFLPIQYPQTKDDWLKMMLWWNLSNQQKIWMMYSPGDNRIIDFTPLIMVILSIEEEVEEEVEEVEEEEDGFKKGK